MPKTAAGHADAEAPAKTHRAGPGLMPRTEVVAKVWAYIREHGLQDPANKQVILADDKLRAVFGRDRCTMFEMQELLSPHLAAA